MPKGENFMADNKNEKQGKNASGKNKTQGTDQNRKENATRSDVKGDKKKSDR